MILTFDSNVLLTSFPKEISTDYLNFEASVLLTGFSKEVNNRVLFLEP